MTKDGKLSKRDVATLNRALGILSRWTEIYEDEEVSEDGCIDREYEYLYENAMSAVAGLCEFTGNYME